LVAAKGSFKVFSRELRRHRHNCRGADAIGAGPAAGTAGVKTVGLCILGRMLLR
jgi:hypothetical protein